MKASGPLARLSPNEASREEGSGCKAGTDKGRSVHFRERNRDWGLKKPMLVEIKKLFSYG